MNSYSFAFCSTPCAALPSGALWLPDQSALCVSDLHLGKSERIARRSGVMLPPYDSAVTLQKLQDDIAATNPKTVVCLGDSFDDLDAVTHLDDATKLWVTRLQAGRRWVWIEGNHDAGPIDLGGTHRSDLILGTLILRHIATDTKAEVSGHYHPKHRLAGRSRPAFLVGTTRLIMPAYGAYTGGLDSNSGDVQALFDTPPLAIVTGTKAFPVPTQRF